MATSLSSIITSIENAVSTTESDVQSWVAQIQAGIAVVESDIGYGLQWIASQAPNWVSDLQAVDALAAVIPGLSLPVSVATLIAEAIAGLQSVQTSVAAQTTTGTTLVAAYNAVANAKAAQAAILQTITTAPTPAAPKPAA